MADKRASIEQVKAKHETALMQIDGVEGVGIGESGGKRVVKVYVSSKSRALRDRIRAELEGYPVSVEFSGEFRAL